MVGPNGLLVAALRLQVAQWAGSMKQPVTLLATDSAIVGSVAPHYRFPASFEIGAAPTPADFPITDAPLPDPAEGEVLVRGIYLSLDPYMRGRISGQRS